MKKIVSCTLAAILAVSMLAVPALALDLEPGTGDGFYVRDTANVLSTETEELIAAYNATILEPECDNAQLVVVTVNYLDEDSDLAATELLNDWGVGSSSQSNGMLLLLVAEEYRGWLAVGQGLSRKFDDDKAAEYLDKYFWDYIDKDQFDKGVQTLAGGLVAWYAYYYDADLSAFTGGGYESDPGYGSYQSYGGYDSYYDSYNNSASGSTASLIFGIILILLIIWLIGTISRFSRLRRWGYAGRFIPVFWFGGGRRYRSCRDRLRRGPPPPPPGPGPGPGGPAGFGGPGGFMGGGWGRGFGGANRTGGAGRRTSSFRSGGGFHGGHGGGFGGHSGGGGAGRR